jgi:cation-transporting ATPase E
VSPEQKQRLVRSLREQDQYVAMTGDGVNDILALKQAHVSIALQGGSQAAREVADMVLLEISALPMPSGRQRILNGMQIS